MAEDFCLMLDSPFILEGWLPLTVFTVSLPLFLDCSFPEAGLVMVDSPRGVKFLADMWCLFSEIWPQLVASRLRVPWVAPHPQLMPGSLCSLGRAGY